MEKGDFSKQFFLVFALIVVFGFCVLRFLALRCGWSKSSECVLLFIVVVMVLLEKEVE